MLSKSFVSQAYEMFFLRTQKYVHTHAPSHTHTYALSYFCVIKRAESNTKKKHARLYFHKFLMKQLNNFINSTCLTADIKLNQFKMYFEENISCLVSFFLKGGEVKFEIKLINILNLVRNFFGFTEIFRWLNALSVRSFEIVLFSLF